MADDNVTLQQDVPIMSIRTDFQEHDWVQLGEVLECGGSCSLVTNTNASRHGTRIPNDKHLSGAKGQWELVEKKGTVIDEDGYKVAQALAQKAMS